MEMFELALAKPNCPEWTGNCQANLVIRTGNCHVKLPGGTSNCQAKLSKWTGSCHGTKGVVDGRQKITLSQLVVMSWMLPEKFGFTMSLKGPVSGL